MCFDSCAKQLSAFVAPKRCRTTQFGENMLTLASLEQIARSHVRQYLFNLIAIGDDRGECNGRNQEPVIKKLKRDLDESFHMHTKSSVSTIE